MKLRLICVAVLIGGCATTPAMLVPSGEERALRELSSDLAVLNAMLEEARLNVTQAEAASAPKVEVTRMTAPLYAGAADTSAVISEAKKGQDFRVIDKSGEWYAVQLYDAKGGYGGQAAWLKAADAVPIPGRALRNLGSPARNPTVPETPSTSAGEIIYNAIVEQVSTLRKKYESNPYITVKGFSITLGISPSVSASFEFK